MKQNNKSCFFPDMRVSNRNQCLEGTLINKHRASQSHIVGKADDIGVAAVTVSATIQWRHIATTFSITVLQL